jgi:hypothetical protein
VNCRKTTPVKPRIFSRFGEQMGAEHVALLFYGSQDGCLGEML